MKITIRQLHLGYILTVDKRDGSPALVYCHDDAWRRADGTRHGIGHTDGAARSYPPAWFESEEDAQDVATGFQHFRGTDSELILTDVAFVPVAE
jgi:hypothetical protein